jgi:DinB superfamily
VDFGVLSLASPGRLRYSEAMLGRPENSEAATYYFTYINQIGKGDIVAILEQQLYETAALFSSISEGTSLYRYAPDKWSLREVLNHITDAERMFAFRALWFARGFHAPLPGFDQNVGVAGANADAVPWGAHLEEFRRVRFATISFFRNMSADAWMRTGNADGNQFTVRALSYIIAGHFAHHVAIVRGRYLPG